LSQAYNAAERVRRTLRAKTRTDHGELQIDMQAYDDLMHELIDIQLRFELLRDDAQVLFLPGDAGVDRRRNVRSALDECEGYLAEIIKEYEYQDDNADAWKPISTGSNLAKFISRSSADKTFKTRLAEPVHTVQEMVIEELISSREISAASLPTSAGQCEAS